MADLTQKVAESTFEYKDGRLFWKISLGSRAVAGQEVGCDNGHGYRIVGFNGKHYLAHRIVWVLHHGYYPENGLDHINRNRSDDRIENLREVSQTCNSRNTGNFRHNTSGVKGVCFDRLRDKWMAKIKISGLTINLGRHTDFLEAVCHRLAAEQALNWSGCDSSSPAFKFVQLYLGKTI